MIDCGNMYNNHSIETLQTVRIKPLQTVRVKPLQTVKELRLSAHTELDNLKTAHLKRGGTSSHLERYHNWRHICWAKQEALEHLLKIKYNGGKEQWLPADHHVTSQPATYKYINYFPEHNAAQHYTMLQRVLASPSSYLHMHEVPVQTLGSWADQDTGSSHCALQYNTWGNISLQIINKFAAINHNTVCTY